MIVRLCAVVCLVVLSAIKAEVAVRDGSYHDLVISFSHNVDAEKGKSIVESLKNLLEETSQVLHKAIGLKIGGVTFHLPPTWDTSTWQDVTVEPTSLLPVGEEDLLVDDVVDSAFGTQPFAFQYGGCGVPGRRITIPVEFLSASKGYPKGKLLAREWMKYRYGVFDENGYDGDDLYPSYYLVPGTIDPQITECTHPEVEYYYKDTDNNDCSLAIPFASSANCEIHPKEDFLNVTSSLMYYHEELHNMETVCGKEHSHKDSTPSKQNILCGGSSIWDILKRSGDFKEEHNVTEEHNITEEHQHDDEGIHFSYSRESKPRIVVAFEYSENLHDQKDLIPFAIRRFMHALPDGSEFGLYRFNEEPNEIRPLSSLASVSDRDVPIPEAFDFNGDVCVNCAVSKAVEALSDKPQVRSSIILIVGSNSSGIDGEMVKKWADLNVCLNVIAFTSEGNKAVGYENLIDPSSCNSFVEIDKNVIVNQEDMGFGDLYPRLLESVSQTYINAHVSTATSGIMSISKLLNIIQSSTAEKYTLWLAKQLDINQISCTSGEKSVTLSPSVQSTNIASYTFDSAEADVICKLRFPKTPEVLTQVEMTVKPEKYVDGEIWIHDPSESDEQMPVILYAKINLGNYPIQDARVKAFILAKEAGKVDEFALFDNGRGNPDITQHDGIYSRYFVNFTIDGEYRVIVMADDDGGQAQVGKKGQDLCCGSKVNSTQESAGFFIKTFRTSFVAKKKSDVGFKPSKVMDLRVHSFDPLNSVVLKWTAPGGEADRGIASSYEFLVFCKSKDCNENGQLPEWITFNSSIPTPNISGEDEVAVFLFNSSAPNNETVCFGLKSMNHNGHFSDTSNLVAVKLEDISEPPTIVDPIDNKDSGISKATIRAIVGGSVLGLFLLIFIAVGVHKTAKKIRGPRARDIPKSNCINLGFSESTKDLNSVDIRDGTMRRVESFPVVLYTHDQVKDCKNKKAKEAPLYNHLVGPKPWLSLDSLPKKSNKEGDNKSVDSVSTMPANDTISSSNEMKQLDNTSHSSELHLEKMAKF